MPRRTLFASLLFAAACSAAYADQPAIGPALPPSQIALGIAPPRVRAPYDVEILRANGEPLPTYASRDRFYVQGSVNERYVIRISNPTPRRIEAVVSVDGLDVIDGENGDLHKRGYVVPAYGETRIEGFRTSTSDVATFRFSAVGASYAGLKGKARNVGVIAVALFEEQAPPPDQQIILGDRRPPPRPLHRPYDYRDDLDRSGRGAAAADEAPARPSARDAAKVAPSRSEKRAEAPAPAATAPATAGGRYAPPSDDEGGYDVAMPTPRPVPQRERLGLGTEFG